MTVTNFEAIIHCLIKHHTMIMYCEIGGIVPYILNLSTRWRYVASNNIYIYGKILVNPPTLPEIYLKVYKIVVYHPI
jgi:hypothetical protein